MKVREREAERQKGSKVEIQEMQAVLKGKR
jgi:hypothetical protein